CKHAAGPTTRQARAVRVIRSTLPDVCCAPEQQLPRRSKRPQPPPSQTTLSTRPAPRITGGSAIGLSATGACAVACCGRWWLRLRLIREAVQGTFGLCRPHRAVEPFARTT